MAYSAETRHTSAEQEEAQWEVPWQQGAKRAFDLGMAALGLVALLPSMAVIALLIALDSRGPVIYRHRRIGRDGKPFEMYKFRSMATGGDDKEYVHYLARLIESGRGEAKAPLPYRKMENDSRVTRVGRILRLLYLDELPQLVNVVKGEMSLVGPRPHVQFEVNYYMPHQRRRLSARPGCTGLWQVDGKADCTFDQLVDLDLTYIDDWSLCLDAKILLRTAALMLQGGERVWARRTKRVPDVEQ